MTESAPTRALAAFGSKLSIDAIPTDARHAAKRLLLDWMASAAAGSSEPPSRMTADVARELGGTPQATVIGYRSDQNAAHAALINGVSSHILEMDDVHKPTISHPGSAIMPAALAIAELAHAPGAALVAAIVLGYEVAIRVGEAIHPSSYDFWHTTPVAGVFGAAMAAGRLLGFDAEQMTCALGTAGSMAAGLCEHFREKVMTGHLHTGLASMNGVLAALLTGRGMTAASAILEGPRGFLKAVAPKEDKAHLLTEGLGADLRIGQVTIKQFPACSHTHAAIEAAIALTRSPGWDPDTVARVDVRSNRAGMRLCDVPRPTNPWEAKLSLQYAVASALVRGRSVMADFEPKALGDAAVERVLPRVHLHEDDELTTRQDAWPNVVTITFRDGAVRDSRVDHPYGDARNPMTDEDLVAKARALLARALDGSDARILSERALELESVKDVRDLTSPFRVA